MTGYVCPAVMIMHRPIRGRVVLDRDGQNAALLIFVTPMITRHFRGADIMAVINSIADRQDDMKAWRQWLHQHPEIAYE